jgi:hypothetical protein
MAPELKEKHKSSFDAILDISAILKINHQTSKMNS